MNEQTSPTTEPKVTWLLPVHNGQPFLEKCLESIANQEYTNSEILALDDGSTDATLAILSEWIPGNIPGRIIHRECKGLGHSLAELVQECPTELCAIMNHDDISAADRLQKQVAFMLSRPEIAVVGTFMYLIDADGRQVATMDSEQRVTFAVVTGPTDPDDVLHALFVENPLCHPSIMFRRSAVLSAGNYASHPAGGFDHYTFFEDYDLWIRMAAQFKLANIPEPLVYYRRTPDSITARTAGEGLLRSKTNESVRRSIKATFGIEPESAIALRDRRKLFALPCILRIAETLGRSGTAAATVKQRLRMRSFTNMSRRIVRRLDIGTRMTLAYFEDGPVGIKKELTALSADVREFIQMLFAARSQR
ncbi:MAG: glycosyltransferase [Candidatus Obscuribacterales bacterium]|nr:glycosyltransferase [Candidatus Obscuribacterales bacterium]